MPVLSEDLHENLRVLLCCAKIEFRPQRKSYQRYQVENYQPLLYFELAPAALEFISKVFGKYFELGRVAIEFAISSRTLHDLKYLFHRGLEISLRISKTNLSRHLYFEVPNRGSLTGINSISEMAQQDIIETKLGRHL